MWQTNERLIRRLEAELVARQRELERAMHQGQPLAHIEREIARLNAQINKARSEDNWNG